MLGVEHPSTLLAASNLAYILSEQGELSEAARMYRETLEVSRRVLGMEHPRTLSSATGLACVLGKQGELSKAAQMHRETYLQRKQRT